MNGCPRVSIVVASYNEASTIAACVRSFAAQRYDGGLEILIVDDRSTDDTGAILAGLGLEHLRVIRIDRFDHPFLTSRQVALDTGFRAARGEILVVTDADALVPDDWVSVLCARLDATGADLVGGPVRFTPRPDGGNRWVALVQTVDGLFYIGVCSWLNRLGFNSGFVFGNCAFRKEAYLKAGGYEAMGFGLTEDLVFGRSLRRNGGTMTLVARPATSVRACGSWRVLVDRAQRICAGGVSVLSVALGLWMLSLLGLAAAAACAPAWFLVAFLVRWLAGAMFVAVWLVRGGLPRLLPAALLFEPAAIAIGLAVMWNGRRTKRIEWGGLVYDR
ncbi:glycosyltransferase [Luteolibacter sp. LG18]|uniref:glycosyltransferase n=1 Tax=Luteolibacter sp. LG18 TaxID=2819286 RepID=UPI0030C6A4B1